MTARQRFQSAESCILKYTDMGSKIRRSTYCKNFNHFIPMIVGNGIVSPKNDPISERNSRLKCFQRWHRKASGVRKIAEKEF
jgi:hypothetical protein